jgi:hypothetical protein
MAFGPCFGCEKPFWFDPDTVPSVLVDRTGRAPDMGGDPLTAVRKPICVPCRRHANPIRVAAGLEPWPFPEETE